MNANAFDSEADDDTVVGIAAAPDSDTDLVFESQSATSRAPKRLAEHVNRNFQPLISGDDVGINPELIRRAEAALEIGFPKYDVNHDLLDPIADDWDDAAVFKRVSDFLTASPIIASVILTSKMLRKACLVRIEALNRQERRLLSRQASKPAKIPASKVKRKVRRDEGGKRLRGSRGPTWLCQLRTFWWNWAGIGVAAFVVALLMTIGLEIFSQVNGLRLSSWELVQTYVGAIGFTWGFTVAVVAFTHWREQVNASSNASALCRAMSRCFFALAWFGLANMGLHLGLIHGFGEGEPFLLGAQRCLLTTLSVISLGGVGVVIEKWTMSAAKTAYGWTLVDNKAIDAMDNVIYPVTATRIQVEQLIGMCDAIDDRIPRHIDAQVWPWLSQCAAYRQRNKKARERSEAIAKVAAAQLYLDGLTD